MSQTHVLNGNEIAIDRATPKEKTALLPGRLRCGCGGCGRMGWAALLLPCNAC